MDLNGGLSNQSSLIEKTLGAFAKFHMTNNLNPCEPEYFLNSNRHSLEDIQEARVESYEDAPFHPFKSYEKPGFFELSSLNELRTQPNSNNVSPVLGDIEQPMVDDEDSTDKFFENLEYIINKPLISKRSSKKKSHTSSMNSSEDIKMESFNDCSHESEEESKKRKNKEQINILKSEYAKNP